MKDVLCVILGGGRGTRLYPLTKYRAKPAVPVAGKYRLIDVPVSNCLNSGLRKIFILTQFNSESLNKHITRAYRFDIFFESFVEIIAAEQSMEHADWFQGSADAVRKSFRHFNDPSVKYILILSGDQLYKLNFQELLRRHMEKNSEITVVCNLVPEEETPELGIMGMDGSLRIREFVEKPAAGSDIARLRVPGGKYPASMGIYLFNKDVLFDLLFGGKAVDFGRDIIPAALQTKQVHAFLHDGYWKDIGSINSFYEENLAFTRTDPPLDLFNEGWPFFTRPRYLPCSRITDSTVESSSIADGALIESARIARSIVGLRSRIGSGAVIEDSILMGNDYYGLYTGDGEQRLDIPVPAIGRGCTIKKAIIDKNVMMGDGVKLINDKQVSDFENEFCVIRNGIIIVPKNTAIPAGMEI
jgi:glucose-1-phosphate adenylyltransferase